MIIYMVDRLLIIYINMNSIWNKSSKQGQVNPSYSYGRNAGQMQDKHQGGRTDPRIEVATRDVRQKNSMLNEIFRAKAFKRGACCLCLHYFSF